MLTFLCCVFLMCNFSLFCKINANKADISTYTKGEGTHSRRPNVSGVEFLDVLTESTDVETSDSCISQYSCTNLIPVSNSLCACDSKCIEYKDCCSDSVYYNKREMSKPNSYICQEFFSSINATTNVFVKASCDSNWKDEISSTRILCSNPESKYNISEKNISLYGNIPVTDLYTNVTYRNIFCAICNYAGKVYVWSNITFPSQTEYGNFANTTSTNTIFLNELDRLNVHFDGFLWFVDYENETYSCDEGYLFIPEYLKPRLDGCSSEKVEEATCPSGTASYEWRACGSIHAPVEVTYEGKIINYKNKHCAAISVTRTLNTRSADNFHINGMFKSLHSLFSDPSILKYKCGLEATYPCIILRNTTDIQIPVLEDIQTSFDRLFKWTLTMLKGISILLLLLHLLVFAVVRRLQRLSGKILVSYCTALLLYYSNSFIPSPRTGFYCIIYEYTLTYLALVVFTWLFTMSFDVWRSIWVSIEKCRRPVNSNKTFLMYSFCNWILCLLPVSFFAYLDAYNGDLLSVAENQTACWSNNVYSNIIFSVVLFLIGIMTLLFYIHISYMIFVNRLKSSNDNYAIIMNFIFYLRLCVLSGCMLLIFYILEIFNFKYSYFSMMIFVYSQGVLIFVTFTLKKENYKYFLNSFRKRPIRLESAVTNL